jgi:type IV pilus assembly protein PilX
MQPGRPSAPAKQRGAIMVVSLLLLLVMTVLALTASQSTMLQERMAGNARDTDLAFQAGEAGLRDAEAVLAALAVTGTSGRPDECGISGPCAIKERSSSFKPDFARGDTFWKDNTRQYGDSGKQISEVTSDPQVFTEKRAEVRDSLSTGTPGGSGTVYYTHTVRANGGTDTATVVIQSVDAVRYSIR